MQRRSFFMLGIGSAFASTFSPRLGLRVPTQTACEFSGSSVYQGDPVGNVITVGGFVSPASLGKTLPHEHLLIHHTSNPGEVYILDTISEATCQLNQYAQAGGGTIVELTSRGMRWDRANETPPFCGFPRALRTIWDKTRVAGSEIKIVMGSSYYKHAQHPTDMSSRTVEQIEEEIIRDIMVGVGDSGIRAGIIGEVGISGNNLPLDKDEEKVLIASCLAQIKTGVAMNIHFDIDGNAYSNDGMNLRRAVLDICEMVGVDLNRVVISHFVATVKLADNDAFHEKIINRGVYIEFDLFGHIPLNPAPPDYQFEEQKKVLKHLVAKGCGDRVLLSQDVYKKPLYKGEASCAPGQPGYGYGHLLRDVIPKLITGADSITQADVDLITTENPKRLLPVQVGRPILLSEWVGSADCANKAENSVVRLGVPEGNVQMNATRQERRYQSVCVQLRDGRRHQSPAQRRIQPDIPVHRCVVAQGRRATTTEPTSRLPP